GEPQLRIATLAQLRHRLAEAINIVVPEQFSLDDESAHVRLAQYPDQLVGADHRADRNGNSANSGNGGQHQGEGGAVAVDEPDTRSLTHAARDQSPRKLCRLPVKL